MTKKPIGQGANQFAPTSQFGFDVQQPPAAKEKRRETLKAQQTTEKQGNKPDGFQFNEFKRGEVKKESTQTAFNLDKDIAQKLRIYAVTNRKSSSRIVNDLLKEYLADK